MEYDLIRLVDHPLKFRRFIPRRDRDLRGE